MRDSSELPWLLLLPDPTSLPLNPSRNSAAPSTLNSVSFANALRFLPDLDRVRPDLALASIAHRKPHFLRLVINFLRFYYFCIYFSSWNQESISWFDSFCFTLHSICTNSNCIPEWLIREFSSHWWLKLFLKKKLKYGFRACTCPTNS